MEGVLGRHGTNLGGGGERWGDGGTDLGKSGDKAEAEPTRQGSDAAGEAKLIYPRRQ